jgi:hypothetical protein
MGLLEDLEAAEAPKAHGCKFCDILADLPPEIRHLYEHGTESQREIGLRFGLCQQAVSRIVRREGW